MENKFQCHLGCSTSDGVVNIVNTLCFRTRLNRNVYTRQFIQHSVGTAQQDTLPSKCCQFHSYGNAFNGAGKDYVIAASLFEISQDSRLPSTENVYSSKYSRFNKQDEN